MPENVQDLIIRYRADISDLTAKVSQIEATMRKADGSGKKFGEGFKGQAGLVDNLRKRIEQLTIARDKSNDPAKITRINDLLKTQGTRLDELTGKTKNAVNAITPMGQVFDQLAGKIAAAFAIDQAIRFASASVDAFAVAQKAQIQLLNALNGQVDVQERLIRQAEQIQDALGIDDDVIVRQQAFLAIQGRTEAQISKIVKAAIQLSAVTGEDLSSSVEKLDATLEGNIGRLGKLDSGFKDLSQTELKNGAAIDLINEKYKGFAEGGAGSVSTQLEIQRRRAEELSEEIGQNLAPAFLKAKLFANEFFASALRGFREIASRGKFKREDALKEAQTEITVETEKQFAEKATGEIRAALSAARNKQITLEAELKNAQDGKDRQRIQQEIALNTTLQNTLAGLLKQRVEATEKAAAKEIETLQTLQDKKAELEKQQLNLEDPQGKNKQRAAELVKLIEDTQRKIDAITGKTAADAAQKQDEANLKIIEARAAASQKLADLDKKINDELVKDANQTALERLEIEKNLAEQELKITFEASSKTLQDRTNLNNALLNLTESFARKEREIKQKAALAKVQVEQDNISTELEQAKARFELFKADIDTEQGIKLAQADQAFIDAGDNSEDASRRHEENMLRIENSFQEKRIDGEKKFVDDFIELNEKLFQAKKKTADTETQGVVQNLFSNVNPVTGLPSPAATAEASEKIKQINKDLADEQIRLGNEVTKVLLDGLNARTDGEKRAAESQRKLAEEGLARDKAIAAEKKRVEQEIVDTVISGAQEIVSSAINAQAEADIRAINQARDAELLAIDERIEANDDRHRRGIIGDREAQANADLLLQQKQAAELKAANQERQIKRKQFEQDQLASAIKVEIAALVASAESGFNPILTALYEGLALVQIGIIYSQPNPYRKGTKSTKEGLSIVGEEGPELMFQPKGNKILSAQKTKQHADVIDAMHEGKLEQYIQKFYVQPELKKQAHGLSIDTILNYGELNSILAKLQIAPQLKAADQKYRILKQEQFALNIANSFLMNKEALVMTGPEYSRRSDENRRKGTYIRNLDTALEPIIEALKSKEKSRLRR